MKCTSDQDNRITNNYKLVGCIGAVTTCGQPARRTRSIRPRYIRSRYSSDKLLQCAWFRDGIRSNAYMLYYKTNMIYHRVVWGDVFQRKYSVILLSLSATPPPIGRTTAYTRTTHYYSPAAWYTCAVCVRKAAAVVYLLRARTHHVNPVYTARALSQTDLARSRRTRRFIIIYVLSISFADL